MANPATPDPDSTTPHLPMSGLSSDRDAEIVQYRALSLPAMAGLIVGLLSPAAIIAPLLWSLPMLGIVLSGLGLRQIARNPTERAGRKAAIIGMGLSLFFLLSAASHRHVYYQLLRAEARHFSEQWFTFLANGEPHKAHQLLSSPDFRQPIDENLWEFYRQSPQWEGELRTHVEEPLVRLLLELGDKAQARYWNCDKNHEEHDADHDLVLSVYAITYTDADEKKTFFVALTLERLHLEDGQSNWRLIKSHHSFVLNGFKL